MNKLVRIIYILLLAISCVFTLLFYAGGTEVDGLTPIFTSEFLVWGYILAALGVVVALIFPIFQMIKNPKGAKMSLFAVIALVVIFAVSYLFAPGTPVHFTGAGMDKFNVPSLLKNVDTGIIATYIFLGIAFITMIYTEVIKIFR